MRKRDHLWAWVNHAALNAGAAVSNVIHIAIPPQLGHDKEDVEGLATSNPLGEFLVGVGWWGH